MSQTTLVLGALLRARGYRARPGRSNVGLICIRKSDPKRPCSSPKVQAHLDVLVVVAEAATEDVEAARALRLLVDPDLEPDRLMFLATSAASNVGLSHNPVAVVGSGSIVLTITMFLGRLLPLGILWWTAMTVRDADIAVG